MTSDATPVFCSVNHLGVAHITNFLYMRLKIVTLNWNGGIHDKLKSRGLIHSGFSLSMRISIKLSKQSVQCQCKKHPHCLFISKWFFILSASFYEITFFNFVKRRFKRLMDALKYHRCVDYIPFNFIEILRPMCNLDRQFSELHSLLSEILFFSCQQLLTKNT